MDPALIECHFKFKCPKVWDLLDATPDPKIRHCSACDRDVHLVHDLPELVAHAMKRHCVAMVLPARVRETQEQVSEPMHMIGNVEPSPYYGDPGREDDPKN